MFVTQKQPICKYLLPLTPAIDPEGGNENYFLKNWNGLSLTEEVNIDSSGTTITTAPLLVDKRFDLMANSAASFYINRGLMDVCSTIDPDTVRLQRVYVEVLGELFAIDVSNEPSAIAIPDLTGESRAVAIDFTGRINFDRDSRTVFDAPPLWRSLLLEQEHSIFCLQWGFKAKLATARGELLSNVGQIKITMGGAQDEKRTPFQILMERNVRIVAYTLNAYIG